MKFSKNLKYSKKKKKNEISAFEFMPAASLASLADSKVSKFSKKMKFSKKNEILKKMKFSKK